MPDFVAVEGGVTAPIGFLAGGLHCGVKKNGQPDLAIVYSEQPAFAAGMFTKSLVKAAPVLVTQHIVQHGIARAMVANSGNANSVTGEQGVQDAKTMAKTTAESLGLDPCEVAVASTGTIGVRLPIDTIVHGIQELAPTLSRGGGEAAARAIMTTDTFPKTAAVKANLSRGEIVVGGMTKGVGMICPNLATLLTFITTDAKIETALLARALDAAVEPTFNSITVDGDCSTNDTVFIMANGAADAAAITDFSEDYHTFLAALRQVCGTLAEMNVRDGEGATKLVRIHVNGAIDRAGAHKVAKTIANSLLVKTAIFGNDANWGRIMMAIGNAGVIIDPDLIDIRIGDLAMLTAGRPQPFDEGRALEILSQKEVDVTVELHMGGESATVLTCDLSYDYVKINAAYRT